MEAYERFTKEILASPRGKSTGAFFDFDGTIIAGHSIKDMFLERLKRGEVTGQEIFDMGAMIPKYFLKMGSFEDALVSSVRNLTGTPEKKLVELGTKVSKERLAADVFPEVRAMIRAHHEQGHTVAIVSSATRYQIEPIAEELGIEHVICTELEVTDGIFTGEVVGEPCYGDNKVTAVEAFARKRRIAVGKSFFYSNGSEDAALLDTVGHPVVINPDSRLEKTARHNGWREIVLDSRGSVGVSDVARTVLTFGTAVPFLAAGLPIRFFGASERDATNFSLAAWTSMAAMIARLKLIVEGEEHLWSHRPAVFIFNHASAMDLLITAKLLREDAVGVAKKELRNQLFIGPALRYTGAVFLDREHVRDPKQALQPAVEALHAGRSVVMAPEGTRSKDGRLGTFKRGAFHLARQAGVPIVPIVIHNAEDALPNGTMVIRPAEVKVTVLAPVHTDSWALRDVTPKSREVRERYVEILGQDEMPAPKSRPAKTAKTKPVRKKVAKNKTTKKTATRKPAPKRSKKPPAEPRSRA